MSSMVLSEAPPEQASNTLSGAFTSLWQEPSQFLKYWNYKGAVLSGVLRAPIFLATYLAGRETVKVAVGAALLQFAFRFVFAGLSGGVIQLFRRVEPAWKALLAILAFIPLISHLFEFVLQAVFAHYTGTQDMTLAAIPRSICVSVIPALFSLFAMRRGVMIVREQESKSLLHDLYRLPVVMFHFFAFIPNEISRMLRLGAYLGALFAFIGFGMVSQLVGWIVTNRMFWTYGNGKEIPLVNYWGIDGILVLLLAVIASSIVYWRLNAYKV